MIHMHITAFIVALVLFFITYFSINKPGDPETKYPKVLHMILRLAYVVILVTGLIMFYQFSIAANGNPMMYGLKFLAGLVTIGLMEMAVVRQKKRGTGQPMMIGFIVLLLITVGLGIYLPMGPLSALFY